MAKPNTDITVPEIKIPDPNEVVREKYDQILSLVIIVLFVGFVTLLLTVFGLVIDAWNNRASAEQQVSAQQQEILNELRNMQPPAPVRH